MRTTIEQAAITLDLLWQQGERIIEGQRRADVHMAQIGDDLQEIKQRLGFLEEGYASLSRRIDRIGSDVEQIKRRLDVVDPALPQGAK